MRSIASITLWLFILGTALVLGAGLYETLVVVPFWSDGAPASLGEGNPLLQVQIRAGHAFWQYFTPALGAVALIALVTSFAAPQRHMIWRLGATGLLVLISITTLAYFRPALIGMIVNHGAGRAPGTLTAEARRWVALNWVRLIAVAASLAMGVRALLLPIR